MFISKPEILLALRSTESGWLGVLAAVLDEANQDPRFDSRQREILAQMLQQDSMASEIGVAARKCATRFEYELDHACRNTLAEHMHTELTQTDTQGRKLTLVG
ncbi:hypothetical protein [Oleiagrimonas sp.]|jgi:hypothetical protein|uniref:hypothetical protein n=1 Tax=Oleiagrimonas sp. TaxID=2010330 RepID=UPI002631C7A5|nr:hypothetical protein [Oleiagrimonas sp.]MDA3912806.1 hypothetical protein [Oleiagrimonas sp.]